MFRNPVKRFVSFITLLKRRGAATLQLEPGHLLGGPSHVDAGRGGVGTLGDAEVDADPSAVDLLITHGFFGRLRVLC